MQRDLRSPLTITRSEIEIDEDATNSGHIKNQRIKKNLKLINKIEICLDSCLRVSVFKSSEKKDCGVQLSTYM